MIVNLILTMIIAKFLSEFSFQALSSLVYNFYVIYE